MLIYIGQEEVYSQGSDLIERLLRINCNGMQIHRQTNKHGKAISSILEVETERKDNSRIYAMLDGSMLLTREEGWKEVKIGRVFSQQSQVSINEKRNWIRDSEYVAYLGGYQEFTNKMSILTDKYDSLAEELVFINDGAKWIWKWVDTAYPKATQILDFYHAKEHLSNFSKLYFSDKQEHRNWLQVNGELLKSQGVKVVIQLIEQLPKKSNTLEKAKEKLLQYYKNNEKRMDYPSYLKRGLLIGSGAIEAAHRTISQKRLKLSGQHWTKEGAQNVLNLRVLNLSNKWEEIQDLLRAA